MPASFTDEKLKQHVPGGLTKHILVEMPEATRSCFDQLHGELNAKLIVFSGLDRLQPFILLKE